jgi:DNA-directed RNA polymerase specialized sigma24 family protein
MLSIDDVLRKLEAFDERKASIVMLRYFVGLSFEDTAKAMDLTLATVRLEWAFARAWMHQQMA